MQGQLEILLFLSKFCRHGGAHHRDGYHQTLRGSHFLSPERNGPNRESGPQRRAETIVMEIAECSYPPRLDRLGSRPGPGAAEADRDHPLKEAAAGRHWGGGPSGAWRRGTAQRIGAARDAEASKRRWGRHTMVELAKTWNGEAPAGPLGRARRRRRPSGLQSRSRAGQVAPPPKESYHSRMVRSEPEKREDKVWPLGSTAWSSHGHLTPLFQRLDPPAVSVPGQGWRSSACSISRVRNLSRQSPRASPFVGRSPGRPPAAEQNPPQALCC